LPGVTIVPASTVDDPSEGALASPEDPLSPSRDRPPSLEVAASPVCVSEELVPHATHTSKSDESARHLDIERCAMGHTSARANHTTFVERTTVVE
jgi:hypothetical protein